jgi:hypothetical protein
VDVKKKKRKGRKEKKKEKKFSQKCMCVFECFFVMDAFFMIKSQRLKKNLIF